MTDAEFDAFVISEFPALVGDQYEIAVNPALDIRKRRTALFTSVETLLSFSLMPLVHFLIEQRKIDTTLDTAVGRLALPTFECLKGLLRKVTKLKILHESKELGEYVLAVKEAMQKADQDDNAFEVDSGYGLGSHDKLRLIEAFQGLRNFASHESTKLDAGLDELFSREVLIYLPRLRDLFRCFEFLGSYELESQDLNGAKVCYLKSDSKNVVYNLHPLVIKDSDSEKPLLFAGCWQNLNDYEVNKVKYENSASKPIFKSDKRICKDFIAFVDGAGIRFLHRFDVAHPSTLAERFNLQTERTVEELKRSSIKGIYVQRKNLDDALRKFVDPANKSTGMILSGVGGSGKSQALSQLANDLSAKKDHGVFLVRCDKFTIEPGLRPGSVLFSGLKQLLGIDEDSQIKSVFNLIDNINKNQARTNKIFFTLIFDGINEATHSEAALFNEIVELVKYVGSLSWIKIIVSSRIEFLNAVSKRWVKKREKNKAADDSAFFRPDEKSDFWSQGLFFAWSLKDLSIDERKLFYESLNQSQETHLRLPPWENVKDEIRGVFARPLHISVWFKMWNRLTEERKAELNQSSNPAAKLFQFYLDSELKVFSYLNTHLQKMAELMLAKGQPALEDFELDNAGFDIREADNLVGQGLFECTISSDFKIRYQPFHDRLAEAIGARGLRMIWDAIKGNSDKFDRIELAEEAWKKWSKTEYLIDSFSHFIYRLLNENNAKDAFEILEIIDWQMPPKSSWFFFAGRIELSRQFREELNKFTLSDPQKQKNLYQLSLAHIRLGDPVAAIKSIENARAYGKACGERMPIALSMYENLCWKNMLDGVKASLPGQGKKNLLDGLRKKRKLRKAKELITKSLSCLRQAENLSKETAQKWLLGNIYGHRATLIRDFGDLVAYASNGSKDDCKQNAQALYEQAINLNNTGQMGQAFDLRSLCWWRIEAARLHRSLNDPVSALKYLNEIFKSGHDKELDAKIKLDFLIAFAEVKKTVNGYLTSDAENCLIRAVILANQIGDLDKRKEAEDLLGYSVREKRGG